MTTLTTTLYPFLFGVKIRLEGSVEDGGRIEIRGDEIGDELAFKLAPSLFALVAVLARRSLSVMSLELPLAKTFVKKQELYQQLRPALHLSDIDCINKYSHNTRNRIESQVAAHLGTSARHFRQLIQTTELGLRLSVPPELIEVDVIDWAVLAPDPGL